MQTATLRSGVVIVVCTLGLATLTLVQWTAVWLSGAADISVVAAIVLIAGVLLALLLMAGFWSAAVCDAAQAGLILALFIATTVVALFKSNAVASLQAVPATDANAWFAGYAGVLATALLVGAFFAAFGSTAQPQAISRYWACKDDNELQGARRLALLCGTLSLSMALLIGWCARSLSLSGGEGRILLPQLFEQLMPSSAPALQACLVVAIAAGCISPLVAMATHVASDLRSSQRALSLPWCRAAAAVLVLVVAAGAAYVPVGGEDRLWFCWQAMSASFGPLLLVRLTGKRIRSGSSLGAMWAGFVLTAVFHLMPDTPGDLLERSLPFIAGMGIALSGGERRRNPDRADRGDRTVYDHLPI